jgi:hypothetical protein
MTASDCPQSIVLDGLQLFQRSSAHFRVLKGTGIIDERSHQSLICEEKGFLRLTPGCTREGIHDLVPVRQPGFEVIGMVRVVNSAITDET